MTLDDLTLQLKAAGFEISRSAAYLRLIPRRANTNEGKRHTKTVPVKLVKAQTSEHKSHMDSEFAAATIRALDCLASYLGPDEVFYLSQDDKARVPLGITAAHKQSSILMHMEYRVTLPDHDWVVAQKHKLIPSVYTGIAIKHHGHASDFEHILNTDLFAPLCRTPANSVKFFSYQCSREERI